MAEEKTVDKNKTAVALSYEAGDTAPKILASGKGYVRQKKPMFHFTRTMN